MKVRLSFSYRVGFDGADHWVKINNGLVPDDAKMASMALGVNQLLINPANPDEVYAGTTQGLFKTLNKGEAWTRIAMDLGDQYVSCLILDPGNVHHLYMGTSKGMFRSQDNGQSWMARNEGLTNHNIRTIAMEPDNPRVLYVGTNGGGLFRSEDGGDSWVPVPLTLSAHPQ